MTDNLPERMPLRKSKHGIPAFIRVLRRIEVTPSGCWEWQGTKTPDGYGLVGLERTRVNLLTHRVVYEALVAPIPDGLVIDHLCRNRGCVNPDHMETVTAAENTRRGRNAQREKTHCAKGHPYWGENLHVLPNGKRQCRTCNRTNMAAYRARKASA